MEEVPLVSGGDSFRLHLSVLKTRLANRFAVGVSGDLVKSLRAGLFCKPPKRLSGELLDRKLELEASVSTSSGEGGESSSEDLEAKGDATAPDMRFLASSYCAQIMEYSLQFLDFLRMQRASGATQKATVLKIREFLCSMAEHEALFSKVSAELMTLVVVLAASEAVQLDREVLLEFCSPPPSCKQSAVNKLLGLKKTKAYLMLKRLTN